MGCDSSLAAVHGPSLNHEWVRPRHLTRRQGASIDPASRNENFANNFGYAILVVVQQGDQGFHGGFANFFLIAAFAIPLFYLPDQNYLTFRKLRAA